MPKVEVDADEFERFNAEYKELKAELIALRELRDKLAVTTMLNDFGQLMYRARDLKQLFRGDFDV